MFKKITQEKTADAVVRQIEELILDGVLRPADRLPAERELSGYLDISRPILRIALKELEERGLIRSKHGEGTHVGNVIGTVFEAPMIDLVRRHQRAVYDYLEFRRDVEGFAAAYAAERATDSDREILQRVFEMMLAAHDAENAADEARIDVEFHTAIMEAAHNVVLMHMMRSCYQLMAQAVFHNREKLYSNAGWRDRLVDQHRAIYDAIMARDADAAAAAARIHVDFIETSLKTVARVDEREAVSRLKLSKMVNSDNRRAG
jgi:GntR family transcriptional repressor for pyruvate dehydrogenase complex